MILWGKRSDGLWQCLASQDSQEVMLVTHWQNQNEEGDQEDGDENEDERYVFEW